MFSKSVFPFLGVVIGGVTGGIGGAIAGFFIAAIIHGIIRGLYVRSIQRDRNSELENLVNRAERDPEVAAQIHQLAALKRMENVHNLYKSGGAMPLLSVEEQQAYVVMIDFMKQNSTQSEDLDQFNQFLHMVKTIHFKGNSVLGAYLRQTH